MQKPAAQLTEPEADDVDDVDDEQPPLSPTLQTNGTPHHSISSAIALGLSRSRSQQGLSHSPPPPSDTSARLDTIAKERDALRQEVAELRKSLEDIQSTQVAGASEESQSKHEEEIRSLREELDEANEGKEHFETQYKNLLGRVNTIKTSLGDRLKADAVGSPVICACLRIG
jgi:septal ring factor EnvC (AmiA/AmiB activator)